MHRIIVVRGNTECRAIPGLNINMKNEIMKLLTNKALHYRLMALKNRGFSNDKYFDSNLEFSVWLVIK